MDQHATPIAADASQGRDPIERLRAVFELDAPPTVPPAALTAVVLAYNEALRLPYFLRHHRALGVERFIVIDNGSTDGSADILDADPTVTRLRSERAYSEFKSVWREAVADALLPGAWVLFVDVDELFVYPRWPERDAVWLCRSLDRRGFDALFATMVDMYPDRPLSECSYRAGEPFLEAAPHFDTGNYRLVPHRRHTLAHWPTPAFTVFGGARERLFHHRAGRSRGAFDRWLTRTLFAIDGPTDRRGLRPVVDWLALRRLRRGLIDLAPPSMGKAPLLKWRAGTRFAGGVHRASGRYHVAPDWGALLHFKYFDDFGGKVQEAVTRGQHAAAGAHYRAYNARLGDLADAPLTFPGSERFTGADSLVTHGLMRLSADLAREP